jgi:hypothetical protein
VRLFLVTAAVVLAGCASNAPGTVIFPPELQSTVDAAFEDVDFAGLERISSSSPRARLPSGGKLALAIEVDASCTECYRFEGSPTRLVLVAGAPLGVQYGIAHWLESLGYRFNHPFRTYVPPSLPSAPAGDLVGKRFAPEQRRRGYHMHTLHPIEGLWDFWVPTPEHLEGARKTLNWVVRNRGNYIQWAALDDIMPEGPTRTAWRAHTGAIFDLAHARGLKVGLGIQLFGQSNLQNAFDLLDVPLPADPKAEMARRYRILLDGLALDTINLSFGEFFGADPQQFVDRANDAYDALQEVKPGAEMTALIHVGNYQNLRVTYAGKTQLYYFLIQYANPAIVNWVHTTMYYNLFEPTGQAYMHDEFDEHRAFLLERLKAGKPTGYFPESAYWIAFDNPLPIYLPLYVRSRHYDMLKIREAARAQGGDELEDHILFSTGWEWGYWQTDTAVLRMGYSLPESWEDYFSFHFPQAPALGPILARLAEAQHQAHILEKLTAYYAGRDNIIDAGEKLGIFSQPDRIEFDEIARLSATDRAAFDDRVVKKLEAHSAAVDALENEVKALQLDTNDPFLAEAIDSVSITASRARFVAKMYRGTLEFAASGSEPSIIAAAEAELDVAGALVANRRRNFFWDEPLKLIRDIENPTFYKYGYLRDANSLCFWRREVAQVHNLMRNNGETVPGCVL